MEEGYGCPYKSKVCEMSDPFVLHRNIYENWCHEAKKDKQYTRCPVYKLLQSLESDIKELHSKLCPAGSLESTLKEIGSKIIEKVLTAHKQSKQEGEKK